MTLEYFEFYRGNLADGFETIAGKQKDGHAFIVTRKNDDSLPILDIADDSVDFSKKRQQIITHDFKLRRFENAWQDVSFQWANIDRHWHEIVDAWQPEYRQIVEGPTKEWGLRYHETGASGEQRVVGANAYPENYEHFVNWLTGFSRGSIR
ncbi:hypothetical protein JOC36_000058 [Weissella uvarum]|uniref:phosphoesterase n=1 Tax=Weissella uvarum TaxID=1479233 RepID=UPI00196142DE|nr:phosphoesterase [Weissella uvarum]MBM7616525.1 hypothetical protein [Weissella uvarum]MCM0595014.1 phosphoesterase [Weissella uvarum]